jgi:uncharacterized protein
MKAYLALTLAVASLAMTAHAAQSIDCKKPINPTENTVCSTPSLLKVDSKMMSDLDIVMQNAGGQQTRRADELKNWLQAFATKRDWCGRETACILSVYKTQMTPLEHSIERSRLKGQGLAQW